MGFRKVETRTLDVRVIEYAQYARAVRVNFIPKGMRRGRELTQHYKPNIVILEGWGHVDPPSAFLPIKVTSDPNVMVSEGRYSGFDERWDSDFDAVLTRYLEKSKASLLFDFRGHKEGSKGFPSECVCHGCGAVVARIEATIGWLSPPTA